MCLLGLLTFLWNTKISACEVVSQYEFCLQKFWFWYTQLWQLFFTILDMPDTQLLVINVTLLDNF